MSAGMFEHC